MTAFEDVKCTHCNYALGRVNKGRIRIQVKSRLVAVTPAGVEVNCPQCRRVTGLPLTYSPGSVKSV